jgi:hypothetical protein
MAAQRKLDKLLAGNGGAGLYNFISNKKTTKRRIVCKLDIKERMTICQQVSMSLAMR